MICNADRFAEPRDLVFSRWRSSKKLGVVETAARGNPHASRSSSRGQPARLFGAVVLTLKKDASVGWPPQLKNTKLFFLVLPFGIWQLVVTGNQYELCYR